MKSLDETRKRFLQEWLEASRAPSSIGPDTGELPEARPDNDGLQNAAGRKPKPIRHGPSKPRKPVGPVRVNDGGDRDGGNDGGGDHNNDRGDRPDVGNR